MPIYAIEGQQLTNIADAIRSKTGGTDTLSVDEMVTEITNIKGGGEIVVSETQPTDDNVIFWVQV